ncbi:peptidase M16 [Tsuneonella deserti]|uniref:Peptidase M16 n=1 Tax=Tsuneonella deserti TaxID=2035528 RepID=A0ABQ1S245_9SPHN|nr:insulinase family protein [Tsuneonella deserti]GGD87892.1 peptidase M16 [Tsuneonella deserti]
MHRTILFVLAAFLAYPAHAEQSGPPAWAFETSDVPVDPAFTFGTLPNGMRYVLRENHTPEGTVLVRLRIGSGSLEETDQERGLAHFVEHMAFNGSAHVPEGEMVKLLEREGLAFGADTNASTGFESTTYKLDLPRADPKLLDTALMLMRETASELTLSDAAIARERGVVLAEKRDRTNYALKETEDEWAFVAPGARYPQRLPIGTEETLQAADAARLRGFYRRAYVPSNAVLVVVGAIDVPQVEAAIRARFGDWSGPPAPAEPDAGPVNLGRRGETDIYLDPALSERVTVTSLSPWTDEPDTVAQRRQNLLEGIGYAAINRRLETIARSEDAPYRGAGFGTGHIFKEGRATNFIVDALDGKWRQGLVAAVREWRRALAYGFSPAEMAEQVARNRQAQENAARSADTRSNAVLVNAVEQLLDNDLVPATPRSALERFEEFAPAITPEAVLAALRADAAPLDDPLIRFQGRVAPEGGAKALRAAWDELMAEKISAPTAAPTGSFAYTEFGTPGTVVADTVEPRTGIREVRFANGVRLNLKRTSLEADRIRFQLNLDGGDLLATAERPLATAMVGSLPSGGLGKHSQDELTSLLAGHSVSLNLASGADTFVSGGITTPRDLELQLDLLAAALTDPGFRREGEVRYRREMANWFLRKDATPASALDAAIGGILSDDDPRFTVQPSIAYQKLRYADLRDTLADRFERGAIELALVGDLDEEEAIALVGKTLGALPAREPDFLPREDARDRPFTADRAPRSVLHTGEPDQALVRLTWPTTDDSDAAEVQRLELLERVAQIELTEEIREKLGKAYSPGVRSAPSRAWRGYGTFALTASVDVADLDATRAAIASVVARLASEPVSDDTLERARHPLLESYDNALKSNAGWLQLAARAQSEGFRIGRFLAAKDVIRSIDPIELQATAARYLGLGAAVEVLALPAPRQ